MGSRNASCVTGNGHSGWRVCFRHASRITHYASSFLRILILKPSSLGDVVQALPVLRLLKLHFPGSDIFWWIDSTLQALLETDPDLSGTLPFERRRWSSPLHWDELLASVRRARSLKFDWVIDLQSLARSGAFAWLANGELTVGLDDAREGAPGFYDLVAPRLSFHTHAVDWYLETLRLLRVPVHWNFAWLPERQNTRLPMRLGCLTGFRAWCAGASRCATRGSRCSNRKR